MKAVQRNGDDEPLYTPRSLSRINARDPAVSSSFQPYSIHVKTPLSPNLLHVPD